MLRRHTARFWLGRWAIVLVVALAVAPIRFVRCAEAPPSIDTIIDALEGTEGRFFGSKSVFVDYERTNAVVVFPSTFAGKLLLAEWKLAFRSGDGKWYLERRYTRPFKSSDLVVPAEPQVNLVSRATILEWDQHNKQAILSEFELGRNSYQGLDFTLNLSLDTPKQIVKSVGLDDRLEELRKDRHYGEDVNFPFLPEFLSLNRSQYRVLPQQETVNGSRCWVVEWPGMDRFSIDPLHGFAILRRVTCWGPDKSLRMELGNGDYREVKAGLWLPFKQTQERYYDPETTRPELAGRVRFHVEYRLNKIEFDKLPSSFFDVSLPAGTRVWDMLRKFTYPVADGSKDPFAFPIAKGMEALGQPKPWLWRWLLFAVTLLVIAGFVWRAWLSNVPRRRPSRG